jgi:hypothetical protein
VCGVVDSWLFKKTLPKPKKTLTVLLTTTAWRTAPKRRGLWAGLAEKGFWQVSNGSRRQPWRAGHPPKTSGGTGGKRFLTSVERKPKTALAGRAPKRRAGLAETVGGMGLAGLAGLHPKRRKLWRELWRDGQNVVWLKGNFFCYLIIYTNACQSFWCS